MENTPREDQCQGKSIYGKTIRDRMMAYNASGSGLSTQKEFKEPKILKGRMLFSQTKKKKRKEKGFLMSIINNQRHKRPL